MLERKVHGHHARINQMKLASSGDFFVLELIIDSLKDNPQKISELLKEVGRIWSHGEKVGHKYEKLRNINMI